MSEEKIPTEVMEKIREKYPRNTDWNVIDTSNIQRNAAEFGYRLLCEGKDKEIAELKDEIEYKTKYYEDKCDMMRRIQIENENRISELQKENERLKGLIEKIYYDYGIGYIGRGIEIEDFKKKYNL